MGPVAAVVNGRPERGAGRRRHHRHERQDHDVASAGRHPARRRPADRRHRHALGRSTRRPRRPSCRPAWRRSATTGAKAVVMEVSSHALALHRVDGTRFAAGVFTNLGVDHLDLHGSVTEYFRAKARLFEPGRTAVGITNVDDAHGRLLLDAADIEMVPYGSADAADVEVTADHHAFTWRGRRLRRPDGRTVQRHELPRRGDHGGRAGDRRRRHRRRPRRRRAGARPVRARARGRRRRRRPSSSTTPTRPTAWSR